MATPPNPAAEPGVKHAIDTFYAEFVRKFNRRRIGTETYGEAWLRTRASGEKPPMPKEHIMLPDPRQWGRFAKDIKALIGAWGEDVVLALIQDFFATTDPRVARGQYSQADFLYHAQYLRLRSARADVSDRARENAHEVAKAMGVE